MSESLFPIMVDYKTREEESQIRNAGGMVKVVGIPWGLIQPHEAQALTNHSQTLKRLAERGGLSASEALRIIEDRKWNWEKPHPLDDQRLYEHVQRYLAAVQQPLFGGEAA